MNKKYQGYLIDLDGTIYLGNELIPSGKRFIERLQQTEQPFLFVTNNTTKKPQEVTERLAHAFDIHVSEKQVYTATLATIDFMKATNKGNRVYIIGESGLKDLVLSAGFIWDEVSPNYVIVGLDTAINYEKLTKATLCIQAGALFIGTNPDKCIPTERGLLPGAGSFISLIQTATQVTPTIIGKPNAIIMTEALKVMGLSNEEVIMVGDNYETDIQAGVKNGIDSLLVLTGFTQKTDLASLPQKPTYIVESLDEWEL